MTPPLSIIIPAYNAESVIAETLASVQQQTFQDFEAIVVDDGSQDRTGEIVRQVTEKDTRFILLHQKNTGVSAARNAAVKQAHGDLVAFLDADDIWFPEKLARQIAMFREDPRVNFTFTNFVFGDGQKSWGPFYRKRNPLPEGNPLRRLVSTNLFGTSTVMAQRQAVLATGGFDSNLDPCEDWDMWLQMAERGLWVRGTSEPLVRYRVWAGNSSNQKLKMAERGVRVLEKNLQLTRHPELLPLYKRLLAEARGNLELARARQMLDTSPEEVPQAILRAWRICPVRLKWLMRYLLVVWPKFLGGHTTARIVHRKLIQKW